MDGQDKIITIHHDTVECKIISVSSTHINYEQTDGVYTVGKFIPVSEVLEYYKSSENRSIKNVSKVSKPEPPGQLHWSRFDALPFRHWQAGIQLGGSYLTASSAVAENILVNAGIPKADVSDYYKKLRQGVYASANILYLFDTGIDVGIGMKYRLSSFSSKMDVTLAAQPYIYIRIMESENIYLNYIGLSSIVQHWIGQNRKFKLSYEVSSGYVHLRDEIRIDNLIAKNNSLVTGQTFGGDIGFAVDYYPVDFLSINANINYFVAVFRQLRFSEQGYSEVVMLDRDNYENVSHLNCSIGIQFHF
jgi:hypothetical protein